MSVLSTADLAKYLSDGTLAISPMLRELSPGTCAIDLRMGTVALTVRARGLSHVDPRWYQTKGFESEQGKRQKLERHEVPFKEQLLLHPGMLTLVPTLEWARLPHDLQGVVTARSCWAREGLSIATATFINPGYTGIITLELANLGQIPIRLYPGMRLAQIAFYTIGPNTQQDSMTTKSQFDMAFEPRAGDISSGDEAFIPDSDGKQTI